jgi:hypothetical protein
LQAHLEKIDFVLRDAAESGFWTEIAALALPSPARATAAVPAHKSL